MSLRAVLTRGWQNARSLFSLRQYPPRLAFNKRRASASLSGANKALKAPNVLPPPNGLQAGYESARRLLLDSLLRRVTNSLLSAELRRRTTRQLLYGDSQPFFALVGVSLAAGTGIITKEDELDGVCLEIREAVSRMQRSLSKAETEVFNEEDEIVTLDKLKVGPLIAKGANAVVYAAAKKTPDEMAQVETPVEEDSLMKYPFALKMMFNYDAESNALSILRSMCRETVPAKLQYLSDEISQWHRSVSNEMNWLPSHPNVVVMHCVFTDRVPALSRSQELYPQALPARLHHQGYGRNMSLFLLMKRYDMSLRQYLGERRPTTREAVLLFAQLLEAVIHINRHQIAHRDLKSDNVLLEVSTGKDKEVAEDEETPRLVLTDFGCCLSDRKHGLSMPYTTRDADRGGNPALMAPEVALAEPGIFSTIDYSKSDSWAAATLGYEIFLGYNPFVRNEGLKQLSVWDYKESDLPHLEDGSVPPLFKRLLPAMLRRNTSRRISGEVAGTICQLYLWAPTSWSDPSSPMPSSSQMLEWLLCLTTKVLYSGRQVSNVSTMGNRNRSIVEYGLIASFLSRVRLPQLRSALHFIRRQ